MKIFVPKDSRRKFFMACGQQDGIFFQDMIPKLPQNGTAHNIIYI